MNKKKIAFCFSGQARTLDFTYQYFENKIFKLAKEQGFNYDIFCAVEDDNDLWKVEKFLKPTKIKKIKSSEVSKDIEKKYGDFIRKNQGKTFFYYNSVRYPIVNGLQQWYKIYESNKLKSEYEKEQGFEYDIVVRLRFDTVFINKLDFNKIFEDIQTGIVINKDINDMNKICDHFAFGKSNDMNKYSELFNNFKNIFTYKQFINSKLKVSKLKFYFIILYILNLFQKISNSYFKDKFEVLIYLFVSKFIEKKITYVFTHERYMYENIKYYGINLNTTHISFTIYRGNLKFAGNKIYNISKYEK